MPVGWHRLTRTYPNSHKSTSSTWREVDKELLTMSNTTLVDLEKHPTLPCSRHWSYIVDIRWKCAIPSRKHTQVNNDAICTYRILNVAVVCGLSEGSTFELMSPLARRLPSSTLLFHMHNSVARPMHATFVSDVADVDIKWYSDRLFGRRDNAPILCSSATCRLLSRSLVKHDVI